MPYNRGGLTQCPWTKIMLFTVGVAFVIFLLVGYNDLTDYLRPTVKSLSEVEKCPACYGTSGCLDLDKVSLNYDNDSLISVLSGSNRVFRGIFNDDKRILLKTLARTAEFVAFDKFVCSDDNSLKSLCPGHFDADGLERINFTALINAEITTDFGKDERNKLRLCPTVKQFTELLMPVYYNKKDEDRARIMSYIWTSIKINPEPLMLQILSAEDGWPVPKYYGECGRVIMVEDVGPTLDKFYDKPWMQRAKIASSLLNAAYQFTYKSRDFGFYLTDIKPDNIAIANDEAKFVDLENVIVVDKNGGLKDLESNWRNIEVNRMTEISCTDCITYSPEDICSHQLSDHNYYSICQHLLAPGATATALPNGLLHDIPQKVMNSYKNLEDQIKLCAIPKQPDSRIHNGNQLKLTLDKIVNDRSLI